MKALILAAIVCFTIMGCNQPTKAPSSPGSPNAKEAAKIYPHTEEFKKKTHGASHLADKSLCLSCHVAQGPNEGSKISCSNCHTTYPHAASWALPKNHGHQFVNADGPTKESCLGCHGGDMGTKAVTCKECHVAFPHSDEFKEGGDNHKSLAKTYEGKCTTCHTDMKKNMPNYGDTGCTSCHEGKPEVIWKEQTASINKKKANRATASKLPTKKKK